MKIKFQDQGAMYQTSSFPSTWSSPKMLPTKMPKVQKSWCIVPKAPRAFVSEISDTHSATTELPMPALMPPTNLQAAQSVKLLCSFQMAPLVIVI